jgi:hypothetical protein
MLDLHSCLKDWSGGCIVWGGQTISIKKSQTEALQLTSLDWRTLNMAAQSQTTEIARWTRHTYLCTCGWRVECTFCLNTFIDIWYICLQITEPFNAYVLLYNVEVLRHTSCSNLKTQNTSDLTCQDGQSTRLLHSPPLAFPPLQLLLPPQSCPGQSWDEAMNINLSLVVGTKHPSLETRKGT